MSSADNNNNNDKKTENYINGRKINVYLIVGISLLAGNYALVESSINNV